MRRLLIPFLFLSMLISCESERCNCYTPQCLDVIWLNLKPEPGGYNLSDMDTLYVKSKLEGENELYLDTFTAIRDSFLMDIYCVKPWRVVFPIKQRSNQNGKEKPVELHQLFVGSDSFAIDQMRIEIVPHEDECECPHYSLQSFRVDGIPYTIASNYGFVNLRKK